MISKRTPEAPIVVAAISPQRKKPFYRQDLSADPLEADTIAVYFPKGTPIDMLDAIGMYRSTTCYSCPALDCENNQRIPDFRIDCIDRRTVYYAIICRPKEGCGRHCLDL